MILSLVRTASPINDNRVPGYFELPLLSLVPAGGIQIRKLGIMNLRMVDAEDFTLEVHLQRLGD